MVELIGVADISGPISFVDQADSLRLAFHLAAPINSTIAGSVTAEGGDRKSGLLSGRMGLQWRPIEILSLRAGYRTDTLKGLSAIAGMSAGFGLRVWDQELSYAWVPYGTWATRSTSLSSCALAKKRPSET